MAGSRPALRSVMVLLAACTMTGMLPVISRGDPPAHETSSARSVTLAVTVDPWAVYVTEAARRFAIPKLWIRAIMQAESDYDPLAVSPKGAIGLMQVMPGTWQELRSRHGLGDDPFEPRDNILAGAAYLAELFDLYGSPGFLAAYNAGPGRYQQHLVTGDPLPAETVDYMAKIVPLIDEHAAIALRSATRLSPSQWLDAPLFVARSTTSVDEGVAGDPPSGRTSGTRTIADLSALASPSDGLFVRRISDEEERP